MRYVRLPYDDAATLAEMASDARVVDQVMHFPRQLWRVAPPGLLPPPPPPAGRFDLAVSDAAARFAGRFLD